MVVDSLLTFGCIRIADVALAVAHDQQALYTVISRALFHFAEIFFVLRLIHEELVHILHRMDAVFRSLLGKIEVIDLARAQFRIDRPLRERNLERRFILGQSRTTHQGTCDQTGLCQELSARNIVG